jgi:hypothetical protein
MHRSLSVLVVLALAALPARSQGLGGAAEAFPSGLPVDALSGITDRLHGAGLPGAEVSRNPDGSTTIRGIPMAPDTAARLNRVLGGAMPGMAPPGQGMTNVFAPGSGTALPILGQPVGRGVSVPGVTQAQGAGRIEGASNLISAPLDAVPGMPQSLPLR